MDTKQIINNLRELLENKIKTLREDFEATERLLLNLDGNTSVSNEFTQVKPGKPVKAKTVRTNRIKDEGKFKFSKYLLAIFESEPGKEFDLGTLGDIMHKETEAGNVTPVTGKIKDEISKRIWQFVKRGDIIKTDKGTYQFNNIN